MPTLAPGVYVRERDFSSYAPSLGITSLAVLGGATKGPINVPTRITNEGDLIRTFGRPVTNDYGLQAAIQFLKQGNNLLFQRIASDSAEVAEVAITGTDGGTAAVSAAGTIAFSSATNPADAETITIRKTVPYATLENDANGAIGNTTIILGGSGVTGRIVVANLAGGTPTTRATGWIKFKNSAVPADGDTISISDGSNPPKVFEFDDNASTIGGNVAVAIVAGDPYTTLANLVAAIQAATPLAVSAANAVVERVFEFDSNNAYTPGRVPVTIGSDAAATLLNLISAINSTTALALTAADSTVTVPALTITAQVAGADGNALISEAGAQIAVSGSTGGADAVAGSATTVGKAYAKTAGTWAEGIQVRTKTPANVDSLAGAFDVEIWAPVDSTGELVLVERRSNLVLDPDSPRFVETAFSEGIPNEFGASEYITFDALVTGGNVTLNTSFALATPGLTADADGITDLDPSDYIGVYTAQSATGLKALSNPETQEFNVIAVPGVVHRDILSEVIALCSARGDCFAIIDTPFGLSAQQAVAWHNGTSGIANAPTTPLDSSYAAVFWAWVKEYDPYTKKTLWLPPSGFAAQAFAFNDVNGGPWMIPAGPNRGLITGKDIEVKPDLDTRKLLQATGNNRINPIISKLDTGLQLYGNRTLQRKSSALENIHTRRMMIYVEKLIATATQYLVFEPNVASTWRSFTNLVRPILDQVKAGGGLENYDIICDLSTNPAEQRQNKTMKGRILISAVEGAEAIEVEFNLFATGASFSS